MAKPVFGNDHLIPIGSEPRITVRIFLGGAGALNFMDKGGPIQLPGIDFIPRVLEVGSINEEWAAGDIGITSNVNITLDDSDSFFRDLSNVVQFENSPCEISQVFVPPGVGISIPVFLMRGIISSPVRWLDSNRVFSFEVISQLKSTAIGFAPQELDEIEDLDPDAVGKTWPVCFGHPKHVPAQLIKKPPVTFLDEPVEEQFLTPKDLEDLKFTVDDASRFPNNKTIKVKIGDQVIQGKFLPQTVGQDNWTFEVATNVFSYKRNSLAFADPRRVKSKNVPGQPPPLIQHTGWNIDHFTDIVPKDPGNFTATEDQQAHPASFFVDKSVGKDVLGLTCYTKKPGSTEIETWALVINVVETKDPNVVRLDLNKIIDPFPNEKSKVSFCGKRRLGWANDIGKPWIHPIGVAVTLFQPEDPSDNEVKYVANALPSTGVRNVFVKIDVKDKNSKETVTSLALIPSSDYVVELAEDLETVWPGPGTAMLVTTISFLDPPNVLGDKFERELFVDVESTVGRNTADQINFLLDNFAGLNIDSGSFGNTAEKLNTTPSDFAIFDIRDVLDLTNDMAWQARSVMIERRGEILLRYLPESSLAELAPTVLDNTTIVENTVEVFDTEISDIVTQFKGIFKELYSNEEDSVIEVIRNANTFGVIKEERSMFIYQDASFVLATLKFWLQQKSQVWKMINLTAFLDVMSIDALDFVSVFIPEFGISGFSRVNRLSYQGLQDAIQLTLWTAIPVGSTTQDLTIFADTADGFPDFTEEPVIPIPPPTPVRLRERSNHDIVAAGEAIANSETAYIMPASIVDDEPNSDTGTYGAIYHKHGRNEDMDDDEKSTYADGENVVREFPVTPIGPMRPRKGEHVMIWITPVGNFYYEPIPRWL